MLNELPVCLRVIGPALDNLPTAGDAVSGTMAADIVGAVVNVHGRPNISVEIAWTDTGVQDPVGQFSIEWSNEYDPIYNSAATFTTITLSTADALLLAPATTSGRGGVVLTIGVKWIRVRYTRTSGAGTATCTLAAC